ncbi:MAG TPA: serine/threonine-protein kinase, partial [Gemmatimonadaceae bacterium]|nr:serine/threonine-protein kinase [Gemmatimonadaceae bacterium]
PHLLPLFDSGEADGLLYYVMPYVEGESLRARLERERQLPIDEALRIATAVASALDYAHRHHVIHRDLKPENILLHDGEPVVADFGIALAVSNAGGARITQTGLSLGTPQYMSPEQATGDRQIDGRTDIYSLGAVLYEMLVGEPPYTGTTVQAVIAKALTDKPRPIRLARESVPAHVEAAIERALAKLPADRWASAAQFSEALQGKVPTVASPPSVDTASTRSPSRIRSRSVAFVALFAMILGVAVVTTALIARHGGVTPAARTVRFVIAPAKDAALESAPGSPAAISNDGSRIVYVGRDATGARMLFERGIGDLEARAISGTNNALSPFFSPDDRWIGFITGGDFKLKKLSIDGGPAVELASLDGQPNGEAWGGEARDVIVIGSALVLRSGLLWTTAAGGALRPLTTIDTTKGELAHLYPVFLEDGSTILFSIRSRGGVNDVVIGVTSLRDGVVRRTDIAGIMPLGVFGGRLAYLRGDGTVMAVPFDAKHARVTGPAVPLFDGVPVGAVDTKILANAAGDLVYESGLDRVQLVMATNHDSKPVIDEVRDYAFPRLSPDGKRVALAISGV